VWPPRTLGGVGVGADGLGAASDGGERDVGTANVIHCVWGHR